MQLCILLARIRVAPREKMKAEIISIGTELLLGHSDTNSSYLAREFARYGLDLYWISQLVRGQPATDR